MNILHTADLHSTNAEPVLSDIIKCGDFVIARARKEPPRLIAVVGDIFDDEVIQGTRATGVAMDFITACAEIAPVLIVKGTLTHDKPNDCLDVFPRLRTVFPVHVAKTPQQIGLTSALPHRFIPATTENLNLFSVVVSCLPSVSKAAIAATRDTDIIEGNYEASSLIRDVLQAWGILNAKVNAMGIATVLTAHGTLTGAESSSGQRMIGRDIEFSLGDLALAQARIALLGHIHKRQEFHASTFSAFYSGSITRLNHAETEDKGFYFHRYDHDRGTFSSDFIVTPARVMKTISFEGLPDAESLETIQAGDTVRIMYKINEEEMTTVDEAAILRRVKEMGAEAKIEKEIIHKVRTRAAGISLLKSDEEKLMKWGETVGQEITESLLTKLRLLEEASVEDILKQYGFGVVEEGKEEEKKDEATLSAA